MNPVRHKDRRAPRGADCGFTLLELCVVMVIISVVAAIAAPQFLGLVSWGELDGEARWLANYGTAAVSEAALFKAPIKVRIDLDKQEYSSIRLIYPEPETEADGKPKPPDQMSMLSKTKKEKKMSSSQMSDLLSGKKGRTSKTMGLGSGSMSLDSGTKGALPDGFDQDLADKQMNDKFSRFARQSLEARAKNVKPKEGILDEIGPLFEKKFKLKNDEPTEEQQGGVLAKHRMPEGVRIVSVLRGGEVLNKGVVEVEVSPLGLASMAAMHIVNGDNEYMTIYWDPLTGRGITRHGELDL
jgi:prepilin-type N-terminal cleavage/methylation domain-containing protein